MRRSLLFGALLLVAISSALVSCSQSPATTATPPPQSDNELFFEVQPGTILEKFGLTMSEQEAKERIVFHPFVPTPNYSEVALLPAFHGDDKDNPQNRGIGYEYQLKGIFYVLREWPLAGGSLSQYPHFAGGPAGCDAYQTLGTQKHPRAVAWTTATLVYDLQPDIPSGKNPNLPALKAEWNRLAQRGVCR
jgi:hypothetical protein